MREKSGMARKFDAALRRTDRRDAILRRPLGHGDGAECPSHRPEREAAVPRA